MDIRKFARVWAKCKELQPHGLRLVKPAIADERWEHDAIGGAHGDADCPTTIVAALIHARANTYLADIDREPCLHAIGFDDAKTYEVTIWDRNDDERVSFPADSPVEAYYFACCYWLGVEP
jgi:hypothetical protein